MNLRRTFGVVLVEYISRILAVRSKVMGYIVWCSEYEDEQIKVSGAFSVYTTRCLTHCDLLFDVTSDSDIWEL